MATPQAPPYKTDYIRYALDGLRQTALAKDEERWSEISRLGRFARFASAVGWLYDERARSLATAKEVEAFIIQLANQLKGGDPNDPARFRTEDVDEYAAASVVPSAFDAFANELALRLAGAPESASAKETAAFAAYHFVHHGFFSQDNRLLAHALADFVIMRAEEHLPVYRGKPEYHTNRTVLENDLRMAATSLEAAQRFFLDQFQKPNTFVSPKPSGPPVDAWQVHAIHLFDPRSTLLSKEYSLRSSEDLLRLHFVTGRSPQELAVARPSRMALHETVAAWVTRRVMTEPKGEVAKIPNMPIFRDQILPEAAKLDTGFEAMARDFRSYAKFLIDDHFNALNPQKVARELLDEEKERILERIRSKEYDPRAGESRQVLRDTLADRLLQRYYADQVRTIVDRALDGEAGPSGELPLKRNRDRIAWVTVGGPASGKSSSLQPYIDMERRRYGESGAYCRVNPDDYREVLLDRSSSPAGDASHSSRTHGEAARITDIVIERLERMVNEDRAPDMWLDMVSPSDARMRLARKGGARVRLYAAHCPPEVAVDRAFRRAQESGADEGRFVPTTVILKGHKRVSETFHAVLDESGCVMRLVDTAPPPSYGARRTLLIASTNGFDSCIEIHEPPRFLSFLRNADVDPTAARAEELFPGEARIQWRNMAQSLLKLVDKGITLRFCYPSLPMDDEARQGADVMLHYAHISRNKTHIDDLDSFVTFMRYGDQCTGPDVEGLAADILARLAVRRATQELRIQGGGAKLVVNGDGLLYDLPSASAASPATRVLERVGHVTRRRNKRRK